MDRAAVVGIVGEDVVEVVESILDAAHRAHGL